MKKILLLFLAAVLTGCGIYLAFYIYGGYREDKEVKDSMKSVELLQSQAVVPTMYEDDACTIPASVRYSRDTSRNNGRVVFTDLKDGQTYYIKETKPLEGYAPDNSVYVLTQDENKAWFMYKLTDADKTPVDTIVNRPDGLKLPDTGSREAMVLMYIASILLSCSMLAFYIAGRKRGTRHEDK